MMFPTRRPKVFSGRWLVGLAILAALLVFFWVSGTFAGDVAPDATPLAPALFFSAIIAYIVPVYGYISDRTSGALGDLRGSLSADPIQLAQWQDRIHRKPVRWFVVVLIIGISSGLAHNLLLYGSFEGLRAAIAGPFAETALIIGTQLVWVVVTLVIAALLDNATTLNRAARACRVDLLAVGRLRPFATVAVISTLAVIGAQALFPLLFINNDVSPLAYLPGLLATGVPMVLMAALPVWPVHRRIRETKRRTLESLEARISAAPPPDPDLPETLHALTPLLTYRRELLQTSDWPFDVGVVARLALYLVIPPLTWVGAALIENLVAVFL